MATFAQIAAIAALAAAAADCSCELRQLTLASAKTAAAAEGGAPANSAARPPSETSPRAIRELQMRVAASKAEALGRRRQIERLRSKRDEQIAELAELGERAARAEEATGLARCELDRALTRMLAVDENATQESARALKRARQTAEGISPSWREFGQTGGYKILLEHIPVGFSENAVRKWTTRVAERPNDIQMLTPNADGLRVLLTYRDNNDAVTARLRLDGRDVGSSGRARASWYEPAIADIPSSVRSRERTEAAPSRRQKTKRLGRAQAFRSRSPRCSRRPRWP